MTRMRRWQQAAAEMMTTMVMMAACVVSGCGAAFGTGGAESAGAATTREAQLAALRYPADARHGQDIDVLIIPASQHITVVNRTTRPLSGVQLWLNQQYVAIVDHLGVGERRQLGLSGFINRHGESFPTAGFLSPDRALRLVHTEFFDPASGLRHRAVVLLADE
jgi:hypothetical protein